MQGQQGQHISSRDRSRDSEDYNSRSEGTRSPRPSFDRGERPYRNSPHFMPERQGSGYRSDNGSYDSMEDKKGAEQPRSFPDRQKRLGIPSRTQLLQRQRQNQCLTCGDPTHHTGACPQSHRGRSPTPQRPNREGGRTPRPRVEFEDRISRISDKTLTSVREGDVSEVDEQIVDAYMAARSIAGYASDYVSDYE